MKKLQVLGVICICVMVLAFAKTQVAHAEVDAAKVSAYTKAVDSMGSECKPPAKCIIKAKDLYLKMFSRKDSPETCDRAFDAFLKNYWRFQEHDKWIPRHKEFLESRKGDLAKAKAYFAKYGLSVTNGEGTYFPTDDFKFVLNTFGSIISPLYRDCLLYITAEGAGYSPEGTPTLKDIHFRTDTPTSAELTKLAEVLRQSVIDGDNILKNKPAGNIVKMLVSRELDLKFNYYFSYFLGQGIFDANGVLRPELKKSYEKLLSENTDFTYYSTVKQVYDLLEQNNFTKTSENGVSWKINNLIDKANIN